MLARMSSGVRTLHLRGLLRLVAAIILTLSCVVAVGGACHGAQAQAMPQLEQPVAADDLSAGRRFGARRGWARKAWRGRMAHRRGKWHRDDVGHERPGKPGDDRPGGPVSDPDGKPGPRDHVDRTIAMNQGRADRTSRRATAILIPDPGRMMER